MALYDEVMAITTKYIIPVFLFFGVDGKWYMGYVVRVVSNRYQANIWNRAFIDSNMLHFETYVLLSYLPPLHA